MSSVRCMSANNSSTTYHGKTKIGRKVVRVIVLAPVLRSRSKVKVTRPLWVAARGNSSIPSVMLAPFDKLSTIPEAPSCGEQGFYWVD